MFRRKQYGLLHGGELLTEGNLKEIAQATFVHKRILKSLLKESTFGFQLFPIPKGLYERHYYLVKNTKKIINDLEQLFTLQPGDYYLNLSIETYKNVLSELESQSRTM